jgi:hypothetical protein
VNRQLLEILKQREDYPVSQIDQPIVEWFVEYLDHNSLWLLRYDLASDPIFIFTNEAQRFTFTLSQIKEYYHQLKSGKPMDWEHIPFEYISK